MLGSISPFGERARGQRWGVTVGAFAVGATVAGGAFGVLLGSAGGLLWPVVRVPPQPRLIALAAVVAVGVLFDIEAFGLRLPTTHRQVNEDWLHRYRGWVYGVAFGAQLGMGVVTVVSLSAVYAAAAAAVLTGSLIAGAVIGATFGATRAVTVVASARVRTPQQAHAVDRLLRTFDRPARIAAVAAEAVLALVLLAAVIR